MKSETQTTFPFILQNTSMHIHTHPHTPGPAGHAPLQTAREPGFVWSFSASLFPCWEQPLKSSPWRRDLRPPYNLQSPRTLAGYMRISVTPHLCAGESVNTNIPIFEEKEHRLQGVHDFYTVEQGQVSWQCSFYFIFLGARNLWSINKKNFFNWNKFYTQWKAQTWLDISMTRHMHAVSSGPDQERGHRAFKPTVQRIWDQWASVKQRKGSHVQGYKALGTWNTYVSSFCQGGRGENKLEHCFFFPKLASCDCIHSSFTLMSSSELHYAFMQVS